MVLMILSSSVFSAKPSLPGHPNDEKILKFQPTLNFTSGIRSIFQDSQGNYWFGSHSQGVAVFDGERFTYYTTNEGLSGNQVRSIQEYQDGSVWLGTEHGVSSYDGHKIRQHVPINGPFGGAVSGGLANSTLSPVAGANAVSGEDLWFNAGASPGAYRLHEYELSFLAFPVPDDVNLHQGYLVTDHVKGQGAYVWIATFFAVFGYDGNHFNVINDQAVLDTKPINSLHVRSVLEDTKGNLWIGNNGIGVLLKDGDSIINFSQQQGLIHAASKGTGDRSPAGTLEHVFVIEEDSMGNIWFGDRDTGVWHYDGQKMTNYNTQNGLSSNTVQAIYEDRTGRLWIGLLDGSVYLFNGSVFERKFGGG